ARRLVGEPGNPAAVVRYGGGQAFDARGADPGDGAAPAVADEPDAAGARRMLDGRLGIPDRVRDVDAVHQLDAALDVVGLVAALELALHAIEERRRDREKALGGVVVGHRADVRIDAEDLRRD